MRSARFSCWSWRAERLTEIRSGATPGRLPLPHLLDRPAQDPLAERQDQAGLLGEADEVGRRDQPALRMAPADQRLDAADGQAVGRDDRLVVHEQLAALQGESEVGLKLQQRDRPPVQRRIEHHVAVAAQLLRPVHRGLGVAEQIFRRLGRRRSSSAIPVLTVTNRLCPPTNSGCRSAWRTRSATLLASSSFCRSSIRIAHSSPPRRATVSTSRTHPSSRRATAISRSSPSAWPRLSLTTLKRSTSIRTTATRCASSALTAPDRACRAVRGTASGSPGRSGHRGAPRGAGAPRRRRRSVVSVSEPAIRYGVPSSRRSARPRQSVQRYVPSSPRSRASHAR